jgi:hypothetical protein
MRRFIGTLTAACLVLAMAGPATAQGGRPQVTQEPIWGLVSDFSNYLLFVNITAENLCAWVEEEDFESPADVNELITVQGKETGKGAWVETFRTTAYAELWAVDGGEFGPVCAGEGELLAAGTVWWVSTDNDLFVSGTRTNSFGGSVHGVLHGADGAWRVSGQFRAQISRDFEFHLRRDSLSVRAVR